MGISSDGLFDKTNKAVSKWNDKVNTENTEFANYIDYLDELTGTKVEPVSDVYAAVCENHTLVFSNNLEAINSYIASNNTVLSSDYDYSGGIPNLKENNYESYWSSGSYIQSVIFLNKVVPGSTSYWFGGMSQLSSITGMQYLNTCNVTNMSGMFYDCSSLTSLDLSNFNTSNVTDMSNMFCNCISLESLDLSSFDTSNVTNMSFMFSRI
ncbi:MAG: BspA family leucine-rich repeat surface protein [Clostridia bacterium]|nr:BspA family leucine-rich repeat surface protein [Clostridia bacterium]